MKKPTAKGDLRWTSKVKYAWRCELCDKSDVVDSARKMDFDSETAVGAGAVDILTGDSNLPSSEGGKRPASVKTVEKSRQQSPGREGLQRLDPS